MLVLRESGRGFDPFCGLTHLELLELLQVLEVLASFRKGTVGALVS